MMAVPNPIMGQNYASWAEFLAPIGESDEEGDKGMLAEEQALNNALADPDVRAFVVRRAEVIALAGGAKPLVELTAGPLGPLPDKEHPPTPEEEAAAAAAAAAAPKKKKGKKGKKAPPLLPGMSEAQHSCTACLRLLSLSEGGRRRMMDHGAIRYLTPLLESKLGRVRLQSRQILLNLAGDRENLPRMELYTVPAYITGTNVPEYQLRPLTAPSAIYGDSHPLVLRAKAIRDQAERNRAASFRPPPAAAPAAKDAAATPPPPGNILPRQDRSQGIARVQTLKSNDSQAGNDENEEDLTKLSAHVVDMKL